MAKKKLFRCEDEGESLDYGIGHLKRWLSVLNKKNPIKRVVDFGCGGGKFLRRIGDELSVEEGIGGDVWAPSLARMQELGQYSRVIRADMREVVLGEKRRLIGDGWDLWMFGDCLEHVPREDAIALMGAPGARHLAARIPVGPWPQEPWKNPAELHVWSFYPRDLKSVDRKLIDWIAVTDKGEAKDRGIPEELCDWENDVYDNENTYIGNMLFG